MSRSVGLLLLAALLLSGAPHATAATYDVKSCSASASKRSDAWSTEIRGAEPVDAQDWCVSGTVYEDERVRYTSGRFLRPLYPQPSPTSHATPGRVASLTFSAPPFAALRSLTYYRRLTTLDSSWEVRLLADAAVLESCVRGLGQFECPDLRDGDVYSGALPPGTQALQLGVWCVESVCPYNSGILFDFAAVIYSSTVTVEENVPPAVGTPAVAGLSNGWVTSAAATASLAGSDQLGLRRLELVKDGTPLATLPNNGCVDWSVLPCSEPAAGLNTTLGGSVGLQGVPEGEHVVRARATDGAGNQTLSSPVNLKVDRTAPVALGVSKGGVASSRTRELSWFVPLGGSPLASTRVQVCVGRPQPTDCRWEAAPNEGPLTIDVGEDGDLASARIEMTDEAGNAGLTPAVEYRRDASAPAPPQLSLVPGSGARRSIAVATADSDVAEYLVRICSPAGCSEQRRSPTSQIDLDLPAPSAYRVEVTLIDAAGNVGTPASAAIDYPAPLRATGLAISGPKKFGRTERITVKGASNPGAAGKITVSVKGRPAGRKRNVTYRTTVKPAKSGKWSAKLRLPKGVSRRRGVLVTVTATPTAGFAAATVSRRIRG